MTTNGATGRELYHRPGCRGHADKVRDFVGTRGDPMRACIECGRFVVRPGDSTEETAPVRANTRVTGYVCRTHLYPVTAKGRGCHACAREKAATKAERRAHRRREANPTEAQATNPEPTNQRKHTQ